MRIMFAAVVASTVYLQGCTTKSDISELPTTAEKVQAEAESFTTYVGSEGSRIRTGSGDCLRSGGLSSESLTVECQASTDVAVSNKAPAAAPTPAPKQLASLSYDGTALFLFDSAELTTQGRRELDGLVAKLNGSAEVTGIYVVGHADSKGSVNYNQALSESRAAAVRQYLNASLNNVEVMASGLGESAPVADNSTEAGRQRNRRVEVKIDAVESN